MVGFDKRSIRRDLRVADDILAAEDRGAGHVLRFQPSQPVLRRIGQQHFLRQRKPVVDVFATQFRRGEAGVGQPFRFAKGPRQRLPLLVRLHGDGDIAVRRLIDQVDEALRPFRLHLVADEGVAAHVRSPEEGEHRVQHGDADMLPLPRLQPVKERRGYSLRRREAG